MGTCASPSTGNRLWSALSTFGCGLAFALSTFAETIVIGKVVDATTGFTVAGATLEVRRGQELLSTGRSNGKGRFRLPFDIGTAPETENLTLLVAHDDYLEGSKVVVVKAGRPGQASYTLELMPEALAACIAQRAHGVVVGRFRPPASASGAGYDDLADRIAEALYYNVLTRLQQFHVDLPDQPYFQACKEAKPRALAMAGSFAHALQADAFLSGYVKPVDEKYRVDTFVSDRFELYVPPFRGSNKDVDLDAPGAAELDPATLAAVLTALAAGYEDAGNMVECVEVSVAAEQLLGNLSPAMARTRKLCQEALPHRGLLKDESTP